MFWKKKQKHKLISVRPKNYRRIALYAIQECENPIVWMDGKHIDDSSEHGPLVQKQIRECLDFLIMDGDKEVLGFHDHPDEMWIAEDYKHIAEYCHNEGWLKIQSSI